MRIKLDENLGRQAAQLLSRVGHDVAGAWEQGLGSSEDRSLIAACRDEGRCLVTLDMDFGNPLMFPPREYAGIAVLRLPAKPTVEDLFDAVQTLIAGLRSADIAGKLWVVHRGRIREYEPES